MVRARIMQRVALGLSILVLLSFGSTVWGQGRIEYISPNIAKQGETVTVRFYLEGYNFCIEYRGTEMPHLCLRYGSNNICAKAGFWGCGPGQRSSAAATLTIPHDAQVGAWTVRLDDCGVSPLIRGFAIWSSTTEYGYGGGVGTPEDPYQIITAEHLITLGGISDHYDKCFVMTGDIDMGGATSLLPLLRGIMAHRLLVFLMGTTIR